MGRKHNTVGDLLKPSFASISGEDQKFQLASVEIQQDTDSTILVLERARGSNLESAFCKQRGWIINETTHTLSLSSSGKAALRPLPKRDVVHVLTD